MSAEKRPRTGPGFRVRCPKDDGSMDHLAITVDGAMELGQFAKLMRAIPACHCGAGMVMLDGSAQEPKDRNAKGAARG